VTPEPDHQRDFLIRLRRVEGQVRAVQGMVERGASCADIAQQLAAARKALDRAFFEMMGCAMTSALENSADIDAARQQTADLGKLLAKYG